MQLSRSGRTPGVCETLRRSFNPLIPIQTKPRGFVATGAYIVKRETPLALYKGLGAVLSGIIPKMAIRFASFESYKGWLSNKETGKANVGSIFIGASSSLLLSNTDPNVRQHSRSWSWNNRSRRGCNPNGSGQNPSAGATTFAGGPNGYSEISECGTCCLYHRPRRRNHHTLPWRYAHCLETGDKSRYLST